MFKIREKVQSIWKKAHETTQVVNYFKKRDMGLCQTNKARTFLKPFTYALSSRRYLSKLKPDAKLLAHSNIIYCCRSYPSSLSYRSNALTEPSGR